MALELHSDLADSDLTNADLNFEADIKEAEADFMYIALAEAEHEYTLRRALVEAEDIDNYYNRLEITDGLHAADLDMDDDYSPYAEPEPRRPFRINYAAIPTNPTPATQWQEILRIVKVYYWLPIHNDWCTAWKNACGDAPYLYYGNSPSPSRWNVSDDGDDWRHLTQSSPENSDS
jgi:hypothetical protein